MTTVSKEIVQERQPFDVAWRTIDGLRIRYATAGKGDEQLVLFSPFGADVRRINDLDFDMATPPRRPTLELPHHVAPRGTQKGTSHHRDWCVCCHCVRRSPEWASRPPDERYVSVHALYEAARVRRSRIAEQTIDAGEFRIDAVGEALMLHEPASRTAALTHRSFGQRGTIAGACLISEGRASFALKTAAR
jgi:hypothetical protein